MSDSRASRGEQRPSTMASTCSAIGISTPCDRANPTRGPALLTPSATICMPLTISSSDLTLPELEAHGAVAALRAGTGGHHVADPGQSAEGQHPATQCDAEAAQLGQPPGDQHRSRVLPEPQPVADAGGDRHHVLRRPRNLTAHDVGAHVDPKGAGVEEILHLTSQGLVGQRHDAGRGLPFGHLPGEIGSGQDAGRAYRAGPAPPPRTSGDSSRSRCPWTG